MSSFRVLETGPGEATRNMAIDWTLLQLRAEGAIPDTLRFYTWRDRAVTLGYSQDISKELDLHLCRVHNVDTVFRPTGGALVLHQFDLTYSIVVGMPGLSPSRWTDFSRKVGCALCKGMRDLGLDPNCSEGRETSGRRNRGACFSSLAKHEITVSGRKIVGNAKRWKNGALLQHGSIAVRRTPLTIVDLMVGLDSEERKLEKRKLEDQSTTIEHEIGRRVGYDELWPVMFGGFRKEFGEVFRRGGIRKIEESRAEECVERVLLGPEYERCSWMARSGRKKKSAAKVEVY